ncbi:conserved hypothetical protein [Altererythrobacter sp. B11]|uniref:DUF2141 domain-containing protein n=1 Tax=Altererythrobacter sp. B11 TaxID=2060312 RepID=UPI000DC6D630|nr:DUF2141 domain-containing protein [Altererythrobacter sp. B11]BBC71256.1 conserved hypothetical protein [Altererythrobacter sp. B11]
MSTTKHWKQEFALAGRASVLAAAGLAALAAPVPAMAQYTQTISNDLSRCQAGKPSAVMVTVDNISSSTGKVRVQLYRATKEDWLSKGRWLRRIEVPARAGTMTFCLPTPGPGSYGVAVRHDVNGNNQTDITTDGGAMSNNPSLNIFNLGKPHFKKTAFDVGSSVTSIRIQMRYL